MTKHHIPHYVSLIGIFAVGILGFYMFGYDRLFQIGVALALSLSYVAWGIIHHIIHKDISLPVVLEYVAVSTLGLIIVLSLIFSS